MGDILSFYFGRTVESISDDGLKIDRSFFGRRLLYVVILPTMALFLWALYSESLGWYIVLIFWLVAGGFFQFYQYKKWRYFFYEEGLQTISGVIERVHKVLLHRKAQGVRLKQSPYQRRKNLATIILHSASGDVNIPYIKMEHALQMKNYILFKVESSRRKWM